MAKLDQVVQILAQLSWHSAPLQPLQNISWIELGWGSEEPHVVGAIPAYGWVLEPDDF